MTVLAHDWFQRPLPANVSLAESSWLYSSYAFVHCRSTHAAALRLGPFSGVYDGFFDLGPEGHVEVGKYSTLVDVIVATNGAVRIGDYCFLAHDVFIAAHAFSTPVATRPSHDRYACSDVVIEDDVWIGMGAVLLGGAHIGAGSIVGAGAVVDFTVPPDVIVAGNPARIVRSLGKP
jgi:acetyltransferase-like isoleucine patch superfamily enzyme